MIRPASLPLLVLLAWLWHAETASAAMLPEPDNPPVSLALAEEQFARGEWQQAIETGKSLQSADGLALAARAALASAAYEPDRALRLTAIAQALDLTGRALDLEAAHPEALLQTAAAYGFRARITRRADDARLARSYLDRALMAAPANPYVLAGLGSWHGNIVLETGRLIAGLWFRARRSSMIMAYDAALALAPDNLAIRAGYGLLLLRFDDKDLNDRGRVHLYIAASLTAKNAFERHQLAQIQHILKAIAQGADARDIKDMANATTPYAGHVFPESPYRQSRN